MSPVIASVAATVEATMDKLAALEGIATAIFLDNDWSILVTTCFDEKVR
jgi:hypothetical protein